LRIAAALWHYIEDLDRWRLIIVFSSLVDREGPLRAYTRIQEVLTEMNPKELLLGDISVMGVNDYAFRELRSQVGQSVPVGNRIRKPLAEEPEAQSSIRCNHLSVGCSIARFLILWVSLISS